MTALARIECNQASVLKRLTAVETTEKQCGRSLGSPLSTLNEFYEFDNRLADEKTRKFLVSLQNYLYMSFSVLSTESNMTFMAMDQIILVLSIFYLLSLLKTLTKLTVSRIIIIGT